MVQQDLTQSETTVDWVPEEGDFPGGVRSPEWINELARLRQGCPVAHSDMFGGFHTLTRYADVSKAALDFKTYRAGRPFVRVPGMKGLIPSGLNPPEHGIYRRVLNKYFTPERMDAIRPRLRQYVIEGLEPLLTAGSGDIVQELCQPYPARALSALMNLGEDAHVKLLSHFARFAEVGWDPEAMNELMFKVFAEHITNVVAERRQQPLDPEQDILSGIMAMDVGGEPIRDETVVAVGVALIGAGHATTADALSTSIYRLAVDPYLQARLRREPELIPQAVEEFLRLESPLPERGRFANTDIELHGTTIPEGSLVALNFGAANLDPEEFDHPEACIISRSPNRHLAFGHGAHKCAGAPLARVELAVALAELLARTQNFELAGPTQNAEGLMLNGISTLPLRLTPARLP
ncbi:MAG: cytochrome P450 [Rhodococcus sp. (in: high G+C Gram-positive bacteria)]|nr:MAG: cytochrome P450 [Rhodococcus sp. (in: high G+C Gram-positive bacteria)]